MKNPAGHHLVAIRPNDRTDDRYNDRNARRSQLCYFARSHCPFLDRLLALPCARPFCHQAPVIEDSFRLEEAKKNRDKAQDNDQSAATSELQRVETPHRATKQHKQKADCHDDHSALRPVDQPCPTHKMPMPSPPQGRQQRSAASIRILDLCQISFETSVDESHAEQVPNQSRTDRDGEDAPASGNINEENFIHKDPLFYLLRQQVSR